MGYVNLPTAALIASHGMQVIGIDTNEDVVNTVASGAIHIAEPDLDGLVQKVVSSGLLVVTNKPQPADVFMIAVPTPIDDANRPDLTSATAAIESIAPLLVSGNLVILESTSPVGTTEAIAKKIMEKRPNLSVGSVDKENAACVFSCILSRARIAESDSRC